MAGPPTDGGSEEEPSCCVAVAARRAIGSCEECGDNGGVPLRRGVASVNDDVANRALRGR